MHELSSIFEVPSEAILAAFVGIAISKNPNKRSEAFRNLLDSAEIDPGYIKKAVSEAIE